MLTWLCYFNLKTDIENNRKNWSNPPHPPENWQRREYTVYTGTVEIAGSFLSFWYMLLVRIIDSSRGIPGILGFQWDCRKCPLCCCSTIVQLVHCTAGTVVGKPKYFLTQLTNTTSARHRRRSTPGRHGALYRFIVGFDSSVCPYLLPYSHFPLSYLLPYLV